MTTTRIDRPPAGELHRRIFDAAPLALVLVDAEGRIELANATAGRLLGRARGELLGRPLEALLPGWSEAEIGWGERRGNEIAVVPVPIEGGSLRLVAFRDASAWAELRRANEDLEQFAVVASHELQEPLRGVAFAIQLVQQMYGDRLGSRGGEYLRRALDSTFRMQALIRDLLSYSRADAWSPLGERTDLGGVLEAVLSDLAVTIREAGARIEAGPLPAVAADPVVLRRILLNLISNAVKFRRPDQGPTVAIRARRRDAAWEISVADDGIGIDPRFHPRLFRAFQRLHAAREYAGTGLGLAICRKLVERIGGTIGLDSHPGQGSTFYFTIPDGIQDDRCH